jgi:tRNA(adenine34) deaminase
MCGGALYWSQIDKVVFAARDDKRGAGRITESIYHPRTLVTNGLLAEESANLLKDFFAKKRS